MDLALNLVMSRERGRRPLTFESARQFADAAYQENRLDDAVRLINIAGHLAAAARFGSDATPQTADGQPPSEQAASCAVDELQRIETSRRLIEDRLRQASGERQRIADHWTAIDQVRRRMQAELPSRWLKR